MQKGPQKWNEISGWDPELFFKRFEAERDDETKATRERWVDVWIAEVRVDFVEAMNGVVDGYALLKCERQFRVLLHVVFVTVTFECRIRLLRSFEKGSVT